MKLPIGVKVLPLYKIVGMAVLCFILFVPVFGNPLHPIHISTATVFFNSATGAIEISMKVYVDDLETATRPEGFPPLNIGLENEHPGTDSLLVQYLAEHFIMHADAERLGVYYLGKEQKDELTWMYLVVPNALKMNTLSIQYEVLMDLYSDQHNMVYLSGFGKEKTLSFDVDNRAQSVKR